MISLEETLKTKVEVLERENAELCEALSSIRAHIRTLQPDALGREPGPNGWFYRDEMVSRINDILGDV